MEVSAATETDRTAVEVSAFLETANMTTVTEVYMTTVTGVSAVEVSAVTETDRTAVEVSALLETANMMTVTEVSAVEVSAATETYTVRKTNVDTVRYGVKPQLVVLQMIWQVHWYP